MPVGTEGLTFCLTEALGYGVPQLALCFEMEAEIAIVGFLNFMLGFLILLGPCPVFLPYNMLPPTCFPIAQVILGINITH